jgi:hypothetical protein
MKKLLIFISILFIIPLAFGQNISQVHVKGVGLTRDEALQDALRAAVSQASGVVLASFTQVENFVTLKDAINTHTEGVVTKYTITKETPLSKTFEIEIDAEVSQDAIKQNALALESLVGGIRFLVIYDARKFSEEKQVFLKFAVDRMNEYLISKKYRYIETDRFENLKDAAVKVLGADTSTASFVQKLGVYSDAQFIMNISDLSIRKAENGSIKVTIEAKAYDNCVSEGLGTVVMEGDFSAIPDYNDACKYSVRAAVTNGFDRLLMFFFTSIGNWSNNGAPYQLRFFETGTYRDFIELKNKLKADPDFGSSIEIVNMPGYTSLQCKYKKLPDAMAEKVLMSADEIPALKEKRLDVKLLYQRQISFAPTNVKVPEAVEAGEAKGGGKK